MTASTVERLLYLNWQELKAQAASVSLHFSNFVSYRDTALAVGGGEALALIDPAGELRLANVCVGGAASPSPEPETLTPEVTPEPEPITPEVTPEPETVTPEVTPEPETVTPEVPISPDQSIPTVDSSTDQGLIDVNIADPKGTTTTTRKRARDAEGKYVGDDPTTPENEAWVVS